MENETQEKINSLSQAERILFSTFCRLINQTLYPEESELEKLKVEDLDVLFQSISEAVNLVNLLRVIDLVIDIAADLVCEQKPEKSAKIKTDFLVVKANCFSEYLWIFDVLGLTSETAKKFFSDFEGFLKAKAEE
jgi:hypothetical protein